MNRIHLSADGGSRAPGDVVAVRWLRHSPADLIVPARVVEQDSNRTVLYVAAGSPIKVHADADGNPLPRSLPLIERERRVMALRDARWTRTHVLMIHQAHRLGAVWLLWGEEDWAFRNYYVNLQAPLEPSPPGFDTQDFLLDIVVAPDLSWRWKDEDEFAIAIEHELISPVLLHAVRAEGRRFIDEAVSRQWPFDQGLDVWRPSPEWGVPELPANWADGLLYPR